MRPIATNSTHGVLLKRCVYYETVQFNYLFFDIIIIIVIIVIQNSVEKNKKESILSIF